MGFFLPPAANCNGTDPYVYVMDFLTACTGCEVDHIAAHWYNCDLPSLKAYIVRPNRVVNLKTISGLDRIEPDGAGGLKIGAMATITQLEEHPDIRAKFPGLAKFMANKVAAEYYTHKFAGVSSALGGSKHYVSRNLVCVLNKLLG